MATSQFTIYSSSDASGPGPLTGTAGDLLRVLDAVLVDGYSGKAAAGWSKPLANSGNIGCYMNGTGSSGMTVVINDNGPNATAGTKEAWATGWENVTALTSPVGAGTGQFPTPAQSLTTGKVVWRRSATTDSTPRAWQIFADAHTFYSFIETGDSSGYYYGAMFGDIFSLAGIGDAYRCMIVGRSVENSSSFTSSSTGLQTNDLFGGMYFMGHQTYSPILTSTGNHGHFMARTSGGGGTSILVSKWGDIISAPQYGSWYQSTGYPMYCVASYAGTVQTPNSPDNSLQMCPIRIFEASSSPYRGRWRGVYHVCHSASNFSNGQVISGAGDFAGKTFQIVRMLQNNGFFAIETSATVETNS